MIQLKVYPAEGASSDESIFLDLYETQPIKLTLSIEDVTNADATSVFSRTFKVPGSRANNIFFKNAFEIDGTDFDITIKKPAEILVDGSEFKTGHVRLQKIFVNEDQDQIDYELLFLGETRDFSSAIGELTMCQLDLTNFTWDDLPVSYEEALGNGISLYEGQPDLTAITDSWDAYPEGGVNDGLANGDILYPLIDHGNVYDDNGNVQDSTISGKTMDNSFTDPNHKLNVTRFKPMFRAKRLWDQIFENAGYTYESEFLDSDQFRHMYVSAFGNQESNEILTGQVTTGLFEYFEGNTNTGNPNNGIDNYMYCSNQVIASPSYYVGLPDVQSGGAGSYFIGTGTASQTGGYYAMEAGAQVDAQQQDSDSGYTSINCRVVLLYFPPGTTPGANPSTGTVLQTGNWASNGNWSSFSYDSRTTSVANQPQVDGLFQVYIESEVSYDISQVGQTYWKCIAAPGDYFSIRDLDCEYQQIDYIKDVITMFRLVMQPDVLRPNHFIIEPWQNFIGSGDVYDWSNKLIREKDFVSEPLFNTQSAQIEYTMQEDEDFINTFHQDNNKHAYGWLRFNSQNELLKGKREVEVLGIAPTPIDQIPFNSNHTAEEFIIPQIYELDGTDRVAIKPKTRFLFYNGLIDLDNTHQWYFIQGNNTAYSSYALVSPYEYFPVENIAGSPGPPVVEAVSTLNLNFANDTRYFLDPNPGSQYFETPNTIFESFWARYISSLYNKFSRRVTAYFTLNNVDLQNLTFDDVIFIDGKYYRPEKIIDAQIGERTAVKCELITVKDQRIFWPNEPLTGFSIIVNDGQCFGDQGSVQVTTNGTPNFTWTITGTGQTGVYAATPGQAPYIFTIDNVPLGTDELIVTDNFGRTSIITFTVNNNNTTPVTTTFTSVDPTDCQAPCNGSINVQVTSGGLPAQITWQDGGTGFNRTGLCPGDYLFYVTDSNGCQSAVTTVALTCDQSIDYYEIREHLNNCTQVSATVLVADVTQAVGTTPQVGDTVGITTSGRCYVVTGITQDQPSYFIDQIYADCASCTPTQPDSYQLESCDTQGQFSYVDRSVVLQPNQVVDFTTTAGCWIVRGDYVNPPFINQVDNVYATCADCATSFTYYAYACDTISFPPRQFDSPTALNIGGVYKILDGPDAGICVEILQLQDSTGSNDTIDATTEYTDCDDCQGITPPQPQVCTTITNSSFVNETYSYTFNGSSFSNQPIGSGQQVTICAETNSVTTSSTNVTVNYGSRLCTSAESCNLFICQEYRIENLSAFPEGNYKYTDCNGNLVTNVLAIGNSVVVCAIKPPKTTGGMDVEATGSLCI